MASRSLRALALAALLLFSFGCGGGSGDDAPPDTGPPDVGAPDAGPRDTGPEDTGPDDTGPPDAGPPPFGLDALVYNEDCVVETVNADGSIDVAGTISSTGCYADVAAHTPIAAMLPFDINSHLWTDGALKRRFVALPPGKKVGYEPDLSWEFPVGTILMKEFILQTDETDGDALLLMETRFLVKYDNLFWRGYSYQWNAEGTDATLMPNVTDDAFGEYEVALADGGTRTHQHLFPGRVRCLQCHAPRANGANGLQTAQMNRDFDYTAFGGAVVDNQLRTLEHIGFFRDALPAPPEELPRMVDPTDETADLTLRARAYIHANCAHCHRSEGSAITSTLWIPYESTLEEANACIGRGFGGTAGDSCDTVDVRIVPGNVEESLLACEMLSGDMPPVGTVLPDPARQVVFDWIAALPSCP